MPIIENLKNELSSLTLLSYLEQFKDSKGKFKKQFKRIFGTETIIPSKGFLKKSKYNWEWLYNNFNIIKSELENKKSNPEYESSDTEIIKELNLVFRKNIITYIQTSGDIFKKFFIKHIEEKINLSATGATESIYHQIDLESFKTASQEKRFNQYLEEFEKNNSFFDELLAVVTANILNNEIKFTNWNGDYAKIKPIVSSNKKEVDVDSPKNLTKEEKGFNQQITDNNKIPEVMVCAKKEKILLFLKKEGYEFILEESQERISKKEIIKLKEQPNKFEVIEISEANDLSHNLEELIIKNLLNNKKAIDALTKGNKTLVLVIPSNQEINSQKLQDLLEKHKFIVADLSTNKATQKLGSEAKPSDEILVPNTEENNKISDQEIKKVPKKVNHKPEPLMPAEILNMYT